MKKGIFKRLTAFFLSIIVVLSLCASLFACGSKNDDPSQNDSHSNTDGSSSSNENGGSQASDYNYREHLVFPEYKDYGRETIDFDKIEYKTPDFDAVNDKIRGVISAIEKNELPFEEQIELIEALEDDYNNILTMRTIADLKVAADSSSSYWTSEYAYITGSYPSFASNIEDMYVAAANSSHSERFENEYFGEGLVEEYKDGGKFTDALVALFEKEEALEAEYLSLSDTYADASSENALKNKQTEIFIELIKTRKQIANELNYESYADYAYESLGRDYSSDKASRLVNDIAEYILPTYQILSYTTLSKYVYQSESLKPTALNLADLINSSGALLSSVDESYGDIFNYMLQHGLFDIELQQSNRNQGAFVTYFNQYEAPFMFLSAEGNVTDYSKFIHEFGHFIDAYQNYNSEASIDQKEISSQALEYLALTRIDEILSAADARYLMESQMLDALMTLIFQGFYAKSEQLIYELPLENITKEALDAAVVEAATLFSLNTSYINDVSAIFISHTFLYPFYVQSYCTSLIPALEMYFMEIENEGTGFEAYKRLIDRNGKNFTLEEALEDAGIASPFEENIVIDIAGKILSYVSTGTLPEKKNEGSMGAAA